MSLGDAIEGALRGAEPGPVEVRSGDVEAVVEVAGAGPYGAEVRRVRVSGGERDLDAVVDALEAGLSFLPERVERFEVGAGRGVLRTAREQVRDREYYEVGVEGGVVDFARYRYTAPGERAVVPENYGLRELRRLIEGIEDALTG